MKSNELRIGNWVFNGQNIQVTPKQIEWFNEGVYDLLPIELTEEWLFRFGFYQRDIQLRSGIYVNAFENDTLFIHVEISDKKQYHVAIDSNRITEYLPNTIRFVHQLQNLYFALTGEELKLLKDE